MQNGFSLLDVTITLALSATLVSTAAISLQRIGERHTLTLATQRVRTTLEEEYLTTLKTQTPTLLTISPNRIEISPDTGSARRVVTFPPSIVLKPHGGGPSIISMYPSIAVSPRQIDILHGKLSSAVIISLRGRVRVVWG